jgi:hypothetical protein
MRHVRTRHNEGIFAILPYRQGYPLPERAATGKITQTETEGNYAHIGANELEKRHLHLERMLVMMGCAVIFNERGVLDD